ncbi:RNA polymerase sigma factor [Niabella terrae]
MQDRELIPHLFRTEYSKIVAVLCSLFGLKNMESAEDIVSDTFLAATELWGLKGLPENPTAWLYTVAKNKTINYLKRDQRFHNSIAPALQHQQPEPVLPEIDLSDQNIRDSQLAMMFAVVHPSISQEAQVALILNLLCGFNVQEIADSFLTQRDQIYKRIQRARQRLKSEQIEIACPAPAEIEARLDTVLAAIYLLFNEGYYSSSANQVLRRDLCREAMRLAYLLVSNPLTKQPKTQAVLALFCFHASRFEARTTVGGDIILYEDQDRNLWDRSLIAKGRYYLRQSISAKQLSKYQLEAAIAGCHSRQEEDPQKWEQILQLYNQLLILEYTPTAALNRTYALAQVAGQETALKEALALDLSGNRFYHVLLGRLFTGLDKQEAERHYHQALTLSHDPAEIRLIQQYISQLT